MYGRDVIDINGKEKNRYKNVFGINHNYVICLIIWVKSLTVKIKSDTTTKVSDRGVQCVLVVYALSHGGDCYSIFNPKNYICESRDIIWLQIN